VPGADFIRPNDEVRTPYYTAGQQGVTMPVPE
jgi:hypothetical protein